MAGSVYTCRAKSVTGLCRNKTTRYRLIEMEVSAQDTREKGRRSSYYEAAQPRAKHTLVSWHDRGTTVARVRATVEEKSRPRIHDEAGRVLRPDYKQKNSRSINN